MAQLGDVHEKSEHWPMTSRVGRTVSIKRKDNGKVVVERKTSMFLKSKKLKADRAEKAWRQLSKGKA
jgi:hypothetical protein